MISAVVIDTWKLPVFKAHLTNAQFDFEVMESGIPETLTIRVATESERFEELGKVVCAAQTEAEWNPSRTMTH